MLGRHMGDLLPVGACRGGRRRRAHRAGGVAGAGALIGGVAGVSVASLAKSRCQLPGWSCWSCRRIGTLCRRRRIGRQRGFAEARPDARWPASTGSAGGDRWPRSDSLTMSSKYLRARAKSLCPPRAAKAEHFARLIRARCCRSDARSPTRASRSLRLAVSASSSAARSRAMVLTSVPTDLSAAMASKAATARRSPSPASDSPSRSGTARGSGTSRCRPWQLPERPRWHRRACRRPRAEARR